MKKKKHYTCNKDLYILKINGKLNQRRTYMVPHAETVKHIFHKN